MKRRHTILVVDDEPDVVKSVQDLLRCDYRVLGAMRAKDAIDLLRREEVHVVMSDQRMPETTGVQFLRDIRDEYPDAVRLLFTGYADIRAVIDAINQGNVYRYITKPWDPDELQSVIREACERHDLVAERRQLLSELTRKNDELGAANEELRQANALKQAFIEVASHELRTPLTILLGMSGLAARSPGLQNPLREWLTRIDQAGQRLQHLVNQMVTMLSAGRFEILGDRRPVDLGTLLRQAADDVRPFAELRRQTLSLDLPEDLGDLSLDAPKIRDGVNHLLLNAVKFTPDDGHVVLSAARDADGGATIRVSDTGPGIDPACLPRLFEPFFTGFDVSNHSSGHFEYGRKGLGLGLSVVKAFVAMHGGEVDVRSTLGEGTTFSVRLPPPAGDAGMIGESAETVAAAGPH